MDVKKKEQFVRKMGKKRLNLARGGMVQRFDSGGTVSYMPVGGATLGAPSGGNTAPNAVNPNQGLLGGVGGLLGLNNTFQAVGANLQPGTNAEQLNTAYQGAIGGLNAQIGLTNTLTPQAAQAVANEEALANQYSDMAQGKGPNPALAQLAQATNTNVNNQAALMAGQRGAGANVGLIARQAAQTGAGVQQQAVGQASTLQAEQQIAAQQNLANLEAQRIAQAGQGVTGLNTAQQNEQAILQNANSSYNNANTSMQGNINSTNAQTAAANAATRGSLFGGLANSTSSAAAAAGLFAKGGEVHMDGGGQIQGNPLVTIQTNQPVATNWAAQYMSPASASGGPIDMGQSGPLPQMTEDFAKDAQNISDKVSNSPYHTKGSEGYIPGETGESYLTTGDIGASGMATAAHGGKVCEGPYHGHVANYLFHGGEVPAMVSPGEVYLSPEQVHKVVHEGANPLKIGHKFNGKAKTKGDSLKNDTIPTTLEDGGVVIDRKHVMSPEKAELFVHRAVARKRVKR